MKECPTCHAFNDDDAKFCTACGVYFSRAAEEVQPAAPAAGDGEAQTEMRVTAPQEPPMPANGSDAVHAESAADNAAATAPLVRNDTPMTPATMKEFYSPIRLAGFIILACGALLILLEVLLMAFAPNAADMLFLWCVIVFAACGGVYLGLYYGVYTRGKLFTDSTRALYICDERGITQYMHDANGKTGEQFIGYAQIDKVTSRKHFLVVRFGAAAWIVDRRTFTLGTEADFLTLLRSRGVNVKVK